MSTFKGTWECVALQVEALQRSSHCLSVIKDTAYVFGGELKPREPRDNTVYALALEVASASGREQVETINAQDAPTSWVGGASTAIGTKLFCFGGRGGVSMTCLKSKGSFDVFDTTSNTWSVVSPAENGLADPYPEDRSYHSITSDGDQTDLLACWVSF